MITATDTTTNRKQRAALQAKLKNRDGIKANLDRARQALEMAQQEVAAFKRTPGYLQAFELAFSEAAQQFNALDNSIPNDLRNSCQDRELKDQFEVAMSIRCGLIQEVQNTRQHLKRAEIDLESLKGRISQQRGEPAIVKAGESLPWEEGVIARTFSKIQIALGHVESATWALSDDNQNIAFAPGVHASDVQFYSEQWFEYLRSIRMAKTTNDATEKRLKEAEAALAKVKERMVWSPV